jgi:tRNA-dependent cyclodipeptide synthase
MTSVRVAFVGQSLGSHAFSQEFYERVSKYCASEAVTSLSIVLADAPHRFSIMALRGVSASEAAAVSERLSEEKFRFIRRIAARYPNFTIHRWREFENLPSFAAIHQAVYREYEASAALKDSVDRRFLAYVKEESPETLIDRNAMDFGTRYILDELTLMLCLYGPLGHEVQIAPFPAPDFLIVALHQVGIADLPELADMKRSGAKRVHVALGETGEPVQVLLP